MAQKPIGPLVQPNSLLGFTPNSWSFRTINSSFYHDSQVIADLPNTFTQATVEMERLADGQIELTFRVANRGDILMQFILPEGEYCFAATAEGNLGREIIRFCDLPQSGAIDCTQSVWAQPE